jgi:putative YphP/YqiW family bacilliredoxin
MEKNDIQYRPNYDPASVQHMRDDLTAVGFKELVTLDQVDQELLGHPDEAVLLVVNSVCGCAAGSARPGVALALQHQTIPEHLVSVFAGMDKQAVEYVRQRFLTDLIPSSPCFVLLRNGEPEFIMERKDIVNKSPEEISEILTALFDEKCKRKGPSIDPEVYNKLDNVVMCSTNLPRYQEDNQ